MINHKCYICDKPATKRMSPDLDIKGVLFCGSEKCLDKLRLKIYLETEKLEVEKHTEVIKI